MSYTFLAEQGEESSAECFSDIPACVLSRLKLTAAESFSNGSETESCQSSRSGMTFEHSTANPGEEKLMSCAVDSLAKTSALPATDTESKEARADYGKKWHESFAILSQDMCSWKIRQLCLFEGLEQSLEIWPKWGLMQGGECWAQTTPDFHITEPEFGWLPTPQASDWKGCSIGSKTSQRHKMYQVLGLNLRSSYPNPLAWEVLMGFPILWTELKPLEIHKFQQWLNSHGKH